MCVYLLFVCPALPCSPPAFTLAPTPSAAALYSYWDALGRVLFMRRLADYLQQQQHHHPCLLLTFPLQFQLHFARKINNSLYQDLHSP